ncbi:MAG: hypothetical protein WC860_00150 [Candidatus Margulisiibacteriota bacterium]|jgi:hypothetical protein
MDIRPSQPKSEFDTLIYNTSNEGIAEAMSVVLGIGNRSVRIRRSKIKDVVKGLAEIAYNIGETNDPEEFAEEMTDNIFTAFKKVERKKDKEKKDKK